MFNRIISVMFLILCLSLSLAGCGGSGGTNGTLTIAAPATATAGKPFQVTATFTSPKGVFDQPVSFSTSDSTIIKSIASSTAGTNSAGVATVQLFAANIINADKSVRIKAQAGDLTSSATVTVRANKLTFTAPAKPSITGTAGATIEYGIIGTGSLIKYTDADGIPLGGQVVSLKVNTLIPTGGISDVIWHRGLPLPDRSYMIDNPMEFTTLSDGSLPNSIVTIRATSPPSGSSSDFSVNFIISVADPLFGTMLLPGDISFTIATP